MFPRSFGNATAATTMGSCFLQLQCTTFRCCLAGETRCLDTLISSNEQTNTHTLTHTAQQNTFRSGSFHSPTLCFPFSGRPLLYSRESFLHAHTLCNHRDRINYIRGHKERIFAPKHLKSRRGIREIWDKGKCPLFSNFSHPPRHVTEHAQALG